MYIHTPKGDILLRVQSDSIFSVNGCINCVSITSHRCFFSASKRSPDSAWKWSNKWMDADFLFIYFFIFRRTNINYFSLRFALVPRLTWQQFDLLGNYITVQTCNFIFATTCILQLLRGVRVRRVQHSSIVVRHQWSNAIRKEEAVKKVATSSTDELLI